MVQQEYPNMLSASEVQEQLRDSLFHGFQKQLCNVMHYLYDDPRVMFPKLVTAACKAKSEQEDRLGESVWVRLAQSEGKDELMSLKEQIAKLCVAIRQPPQ